jgi:hypothetical protein
VDRDVPIAIARLRLSRRDGTIHQGLYELCESVIYRTFLTFTALNRPMTGSLPTSGLA